jgi:hypothetical protein
MKDKVICGINDVISCLSDKDSGNNHKGKEGP